MPVGVWTQVAVTTDGSRGILYVNGVGGSDQRFDDAHRAGHRAGNRTWFGRSQFTNDPYFNGEIGSIRLYGRALSAE